MDRTPIRRALLSVYDKTGIAAFAKALHEAGVELLSSGGTARAIEAAGVPVRYVQEWTGFPEMLGHRVVTLHPKVHGSILAVRDDPAHQADIEQYGLEPIDLVCVGLYPFEQAVAREGCTPDEAVEMIDIGGPTLVRAAAKNHRFVTVVTGADQYERVLAELGAGGVSAALRRELAQKAFALTMSYDVAIANWLADQTGEAFPDRLGLAYAKVRELRYGENPHQRGAFYAAPGCEESSVASAKLVGESQREISYNNYFDANGAVELVKEFDEPTVAIIKHSNPAGCASDDDLVEAYRKAYFGDVNAAMGGIVAVNRPVTEELATAIIETYQRWGKAAGAGGFFAEIVAAPGFEGSAAEILRNRKGWGANVRILELPALTGERSGERQLKYVVGGLLVQDRDLLGLNEDDWTVVSTRKPDQREMADLRFAWLCCKHVKSNAIAIAKDKALLGAGAGQMSRVNSARLAAGLAKNYGGTGVVDLAGSALASDAFFPFPDSLDQAAEIGATAIVEPGGAKKDQDVIARADELGMAMVFTGTRHFNH